MAPVEALYLNEHEWRDALQPFSRVQGESLTVHGRVGARAAIDADGGILSDHAIFARKPRCTAKRLRSRRWSNGLKSLARRESDFRCADHSAMRRA